MRILFTLLSFCSFGLLVAGGDNLVPTQAEQNGLFGYKNAFGNWVISPAFQLASEFTGEYTFVKQNNQFRFLHVSGAIYSDILSDSIFFHKKSNAFYSRKQNEWTVFASDLTELVKFEAPKQIKINPLQGAQFTVECSNGQKILDLQNGSVVNSFFHNIENFGNTPNGKPLFRIQNASGLYGIVDADLKEFLACQYQYIEPFNGKYARFEHKGNWGFVNSEGEILLYDQGFDFVQLIGPDMAEIRRNKRSAWVNLTQPNYENLVFFDFVLGAQGSSVIVANYSAANRQGDIHYALADYNGKLITDFQFSRIEKGKGNGYKAKTISGNWAVLSENGNYSVLQNEEWEVLKRYEYFEPFDQNGLSRVSKGVKWGMVNKNGDEVIPIAYDLVQFLGQDRYKTRKGGMEKMVNSQNKPVGTQLYSDISEFSNGLSRVAKKVNGEFLFGYIDKDSNLIIPFEFEQASTFDNGKAKVRKNGKWGTVDANGNFSM